MCRCPLLVLTMLPPLACALGSQRQLQATLCQRTHGRCVHTQHGQQKYSTGSFATWYTVTMTAPSTAYMIGAPSSMTAEAMRRALVPWTDKPLFVWSACCCLGDAGKATCGCCSRPECGLRCAVDGRTEVELHADEPGCWQRLHRRWRPVQSGVPIPVACPSLDTLRCLLQLEMHVATMVHAAALPAPAQRIHLQDVSQNVCRCVDVG